MNIITLLSLIGYCLLFCRLTKYSGEVSLFVVVSGSVTLLYIASLCDALQPIAWITLVGGWLTLLAAPWYIEKNRRLFLNKYITPGFVCSLFVIIVFCLMAQHLLMSGEDELTHWGPHAKLIYYFHGLIPKSVVTIHKSYPPGGALFYYLFFLFRGYSEGSAYFAQSLLCLAPLGLLTAHIKWKHCPRALGLLFFIVIFLYLLGADLGPYTSLYMDTAVGIYWGSLVVYARLHAKKPIELLYLAPAACCLMLLKLKLMPLVLLALVLIFFQQVLLQENRFEKSLIAKALLCLFVVFLSAFLSEKTWLWYLIKTHVPTQWQLNINTHQLLSAFNPKQATYRDSITIKHFISSLKRPALLGLLFSSTAAIIAWASNDTNIKRHLFFNQLILWAGMLAYLFGLLLLYLFSFTAGEGESLAAMGRYVNIYYMGWCLIVYAELIVLLHNRLFKLIPTVIEYGLGLFFLFIFIGGLFYSNHHQYTLLNNIRKQNYFKMAVRKITDPVNELTPPNSRIFTVWQNSTGKGRSMVVYDTVPRSPNLSNTSFGKPYSNTDQWTVNLSPQAFLNELKGFDYLLLARTDSQFWQQYGSVFPETPPRLKPSAIYHICILPGFNGVNKRGCKLSEQKSYLFKIENKHGKLMLINVFAAPRGSKT